ncbi:MAG: glutamate--cysteine ligase [Leptolyngbya foveolarum]|uniref:Glutamate--cysteine ligase n=1 Tax=Leptolyngbya foveolarum TaxID=47253 RepID=A0A2W4UPD4_9CYAN|nr:MAG: glutamate--cysteine ligase [Leptolyngbya foveolarum]
MNFKFGIEHEVAFLRPDGSFADFANTTFSEFDAIVAQLPYYEEDYPQLRVGDAGIKLKRWYIEGFERFSQTGEVTDCPPKGIEIRTTVQASIEGAIAQLKESFDQLCTEAQKTGFSPALTSFHPYRDEFILEPPLNRFEQTRRQESPEMQTAHIPMLTQGPDLNLSAEGLTPAQLVDVGRKLTYYSPFIIPFSYSSPFYLGKPWRGLSARTFYRTGPRPAAMVFVANQADLIDSTPSLTQMARVPAEVGRIEFKAFDSCGDFNLYSSLFALLKGLILDQTLSGRATVPDAALHQQSARLGFANDYIYSEAQRVLEVVCAVTADKQDLIRLEKLQLRLKNRYSPAQEMLDAYRRGQSIAQVLAQGYYLQSEQKVAIAKFIR